MATGSKSNKQILPPAKRFAIRLIIVTVAGAVLLIGLCFGGFKAYRKWQPERLARQSRAFLEKGDYKNAMLAAGRALQINPNSLEAARVVAEYYEKAGSIDAIVWRQHVVEMHPGLQESLAWATTALQFGRPAIAEQALATIREPDRHGGEYHTTAGATAVALGKADEAKEHYAEALKLDPKNEMYQYNSASLQVQSSNPDEQKTARETLERLCDSTKYHTFAHRSLALYFASAGQFEEALKHTRALQDDPGAIFGDRISHVDLLRRSKSAELAPALEKLRADSAKKPGNAALLIGWMGMNGMEKEAIAWAKTFPPKQLAGAPVGPALAQCHLAGGDWPGLRDALTLKDANWGGLEYSRHLLLARALKELGDKNGFTAQWNLACTAALQRPDMVRQLVRFGTSWGWEDETRELLRQAAEHSPDPQWALGILYKDYLAKQDTGGLQWVMLHVMNVEPENDNAKNNYAMLTLLLKNDEREIERAAAIARELHAKKPDNASFASTDAYALFRQKHAEEALQVMNSLDAKQLETPSVSAYYAIFLAAKGQKEQAAKYFALAKTAKLLPEERALVSDAEAGIK